MPDVELIRFAPEAILNPDLFIMATKSTYLETGTDVVLANVTAEFLFPRVT